MAIKIYIDTTGELVISSSSREDRYPAFSELRRTKISTDSLEISTVSGIMLMDATVYSDLQDSGGTPYASYAALKLALDDYFDDVA